MNRPPPFMGLGHQIPGLSPDTVARIDPRYRNIGQGAMSTDYISSYTPFQPGLPATLSQAPTPQATSYQGTIPQGTIPQGTMPQFNMPQGTMLQGTMSQGTIPQATSYQDTMPQGSMPQFNMPQFDMPQFDASQFTMPAQLQSTPSGQAQRTRPAYQQPYLRSHTPGSLPYGGANVASRSRISAPPSHTPASRSSAKQKRTRDDAEDWDEDEMDEAPKQKRPKLTSIERYFDQWDAEVGNNQEASFSFPGAAPAEASTSTAAASFPAASFPAAMPGLSTGAIPGLSTGDIPGPSTAMTGTATVPSAPTTTAAQDSSPFNYTDFLRIPDDGQDYPDIWDFSNGPNDNNGA
ncbi:hypothetical protein GGS26DRAFT_186094 [Hypomontagnella submonticulosa]|nr:hypothetical protein GGS26DRAFT_186094 [Hypomontagnella submonticulosa]